jgi:hypothetical protein
MAPGGCPGLMPETAALLPTQARGIAAEEEADARDSLASHIGRNSAAARRRAANYLEAPNAGEAAIQQSGDRDSMEAAFVLLTFH